MSLPRVCSRPNARRCPAYKFDRWEPHRRIDFDGGRSVRTERMRVLVHLGLSMGEYELYRHVGRNPIPDCELKCPLSLSLPCENDGCRRSKTSEKLAAEAYRELLHEREASCLHPSAGRTTSRGFPNALLRRLSVRTNHHPDGSVARIPSV